jgi:hypothetical protein
VSRRKPVQTQLNFRRYSALAPNSADFVPKQLVIAGWTGRNREAMEHHVQELEALGVKRPSSMPVYYRVAAGRLTQSREIQVLGPHTSGEVEPVMFSMRDGLWLGIGSDHTDRKLETQSVAASKQICPKLVGREVWDCREIADHWEELVLRSYIIEQPGGERVLYQEGSVSQMLLPGELITGYSGPAGLPVGTVMFGGTFPAKGGIRPALHFEIELEDPVLGRKLRHGYSIEVLPEIE